MSVTSLLVNTCTVEQYAESVSSVSAGLQLNTGTSVSGVLCNIQTASGREFIELGRLTGRRFFDCYFLSTVTINENYRITEIAGGGIAGSLTGVELNVMTPPIDHSGRGAYIMVTAQEAQEE